MVTIARRFRLSELLVTPMGIIFLYILWVAIAVFTIAIASYVFRER